MKIVVFDDERHLGVIVGKRVLNLARAIKAYSETHKKDVSRYQDSFSSLQSFIASGQSGLTLVQEAVEKLQSADQPGLFKDLSDVCLHAPWPGQRLAMTGVNFADHVSAVYTNFGSPISKEEVFTKVRGGNPAAFWAVARPVMGPGDDIEIPGRARGLFDYEVEPGIVIGKRGKDIKSRDIKDHIWGVTLLIDWSIREEAWPLKPADPLLFTKNFDCSKSIGPCIVVDEIDPNEFSVQTLVNGVIKQDFNSRDMIFSFGEVLEYLSEDFTFHPGDVLSGGTGPGTAMDRLVPHSDGPWPRDLFLKNGDTVEVRSPLIGSMTSKIVAKGESRRTQSVGLQRRQ